MNKAQIRALAERDEICMIRPSQRHDCTWEIDLHAQVAARQATAVAQFAAALTAHGAISAATLHGHRKVLVDGYIPMSTLHDFANHWWFTHGGDWPARAADLGPARRRWWTPRTRHRAPQVG